MGQPSDLDRELSTTYSGTPSQPPTRRHALDLTVLEWLTVTGRLSVALTIWGLIGAMITGALRVAWIMAGGE